MFSRFSSLLSAVIKYSLKPTWEKNGVHFILVCSPSLRECRTETQAINEAEIMKEHCLLASSYAHIQLPFLYFTAQAHLPKDGATHSSVGHLVSISNQENVPQVCPQANLIVATFHLRVPFPRCQVDNQDLSSPMANVSWFECHNLKRSFQFY